MSDIKIENATKEEIVDFDVEAWHEEDIEHYGKRVEWERFCLQSSRW